MGFGKKLIKGFGNTIKGIAHGDLKSILSVAAAVAVPYFAPTISTAIGLSGAIGATAGSALTGALMGGISNKVLGGNFASGALMGAVSGGIAGYNAAPAAGATEVGGVTGGVEVTPSTTTLGSTSGAINPLGDVFENGMWVEPGIEGVSAGAADSGGLFSGLGSSSGATGFSGLNTPSVLDPSITSLSGYTGNTYGINPNAAAVGFNPASSVGLKATANMLPTSSPSMLDTAMNSVTGVYDKAKGWWNGLSDPAQSAIIQGGMQLAAAGLSNGGGYDTSMLRAQGDYLNNLSAMQKEAFRKKMAAAEGLIGQANYYDPHYFGSQAQNQALISGTAAKNEALRNMSGQGRGYASDAEARRYNLGTSLNAATQYTQAADAAQNQKVRTVSAGVQAMPNAPSDISGSYLGALPYQDKINKNYISTFENLYGTLYSKSDDKKKEEDAKKTSMV